MTRSQLQKSRPFLLLSGCLLVLGLLLVLYPPSSRRQPSTSGSPLPSGPHTPSVRNALPRGIGPQQNEGSTPPTGSVSEVAHKALPLARAACMSPALSAFADPHRNCLDQALELSATLPGRIEKYMQEGEKLDVATCTATSSDGATSSLESVSEDFFGLGREIVSRGLQFDFDRDISPRRLNRMRLVALCSIQKTVTYWSEHPEQIPQGTDLEDSLVFDTSRGEPRPSRWVGSFIRIMARFQQREVQSP